MRNKLYKISINEYPCFDDVTQARVFVDDGPNSGHVICFAGDNADKLIKLLHGDITLLGDDELRKLLRERDNEIIQLKIAQNDRSDKIYTQMKTIGELTREKDILRRMNENQKNTIIEQRHEIQDLKAKNKELETIYNSQCEIVNKQREEIDWLGKMLEETENPDLAVEIHNLKEELSLCKDKATYNYRRAEMAEAECKALRAKVAEQNEKIPVLERQIRDQDKHIEALKKEIERFGKANFDLELKIESLTDTNDVLKRSNEDKDKELCGLSARVKELETAYDMSKDAHDVIRNRLVRVLKENDKLVERIESQKATIDLLTQCHAEDMGKKIEEIKNIKSGMDIIRDQLEVERKVNRKFQDRIEDQKKTIDILQKSYAEEMGKKEKEIRHLKETHYIHFDVTNTEKIKCFVDNFKLRNENKKLKEENAILRADEFARLLKDLNRHTIFHP